MRLENNVCFQPKKATFLSIGSVWHCILALLKGLGATELLLQNCLDLFTPHSEMRIVPVFNCLYFTAS